HRERAQPVDHVESAVVRHVTSASRQTLLAHLVSRSSRYSTVEVPMLRSPRRSFDESDEGRAFHAAYDALLAKWPHGTVIHDLDSRFGTTRVTEYGPPGAPPVLLLPGAGATSMVWFANAAALGEAHRLLAVDIIGDVGRSVAGGDPVRSVDDLLEWLGSVADALGATRCALV